MPFSSIDLGDRTFRISDTLDSPRLEESLRAVGQLSPAILLPGAGGELIPVCGFRRIQALQRIGAATISAHRLSSESSAPLQAFRTALWDNLSHRELSHLEKARSLHILKYVCGVAQDILVETYLPLLGLAPHKNVLRTYLALDGVLPRLKQFLIEGRITPATGERIAGKNPRDQEALASAFENARWSASLQRQLLDLLEEIAAQDNACLSEILARPEIARTLSEQGPFQRGERIYSTLYRWRNPRLSRAEERFQTGKKCLRLPGSIRLMPEPYFETPGLRVEFEASSPERFRELVVALHRASESPAFKELFEVS